MFDDDVNNHDRWWSRLAITGTYLAALAALIAVASTGADVPTGGPIMEAIQSATP